LVEGALFLGRWLTALRVVEPRNLQATLFISRRWKATHTTEQVYITKTSSLSLS
jgi:hypothetical protein